ncbi:hypothetical protein [Marinicrinis lubricantis]|uniref:HD family phosphohydrolase n=1 Tax=Marinicrinis lubricantis TaxID=2086470 RepID=A0ABW1ITQ8_9BACL
MDAWDWLFSIWGIQIIIAIILIIAGYMYYDKRYKNQNKGTLYGGDYIRTNEVFTDPSDGKVYRVYYNPKTGEREYIEE